MGYDAIDEYTISHAEMVAGIKNGTLDAIIQTIGIPTAGVLDLAATRDIRIVGLTPDQIEAVDEESDLLSGGEVLASAYEFVEEDIAIVVGYTINIS